MQHTISKRKQIVTVLIFLILITGVLPLWMVLRNHVDHENYEKRELAELPMLSISTISQFPGQFEEYINDHLPFRNQLIRAYNLMDYYIFHTSDSDRVVIGDEGWLFYSDVKDGDSIAAYKGQNLLTDEQLEKIADNLTRSRDNLQKEGIEFAVFIPPNRERMYPEYMPGFYGDPAPDYPVMQICQYLRTHTDIQVIYPYEELLEAKEQLKDRAQICYKTDTHWTRLGAYIGTRELLKCFNIDLPDYLDPSVTITESPAVTGDLADMLNLGSYIDPGMEYDVEGVVSDSTQNTEWDFSGYIRYSSQEADPRKILILRDSFCSNMAPFIGTSFQESVMIHTKTYKNELVREEKPDIVVVEAAERRAPKQLLRFCYE